MQSPKYQSYFIINKRRQYQKTTVSSNSLQLPYKSARDNLQSGKRLSVTSRCHRILWEKDKENVVLGGVKTYHTGRKIVQQQVYPNTSGNAFNKSIYTNGFTRNNYNSARDDHLRDRSVSYQNSSIIRNQLLQRFNQMTKSLYEDRQSCTQIQIQPVTQQKQENTKVDKNSKRSDNNYPLSYRYNYQSKRQGYSKIGESIIDRQNQLLENSLKMEDSLKVNQFVENSFIHHELLENSTHKYIQLSENNSITNGLGLNKNNISNENNDNHDNDNPNNSNKTSQIIMNSSIISQKSSKKSKIIQFKQQFYTTLQQQEIIQTQIFPNRTLLNQQQSQLISFTKDKLCSSFYDQQHPPHRLLVINSARKHHFGGREKRQGSSDIGKGSNLITSSGKYAMTVVENTMRADQREDVLSRSVKQQVQDRKQINLYRSDIHSGELPNEKIETFNFSNILTHHSQLIKPSKPNTLRHSEQVISVTNLQKMNPNLTSSKTEPNPLLIPQHRNQLPTNPNKLSSFQKVLDLNPKPCESFILQTAEQGEQSQLPISPSLQSFYQQQLKRRSQANEILQSLINMRMIHQTMEVNPIN